MATTYYMLPMSVILQWFTNLGVMAQQGAIYTYEGGTTTPVTTYTDNTGTVANANPLTLSSTGRPVSSSGAPVAFWVPGGTIVKFVAYDQNGNFLDQLDNMSAIGDLTNQSSSLATELASPVNTTSSGSGPAGGVDYVANAVKTYDVFGDVRAANAPSLVSGQVLTAIMQGQAQVDDNFGGPFIWVPTSTLSDDNLTVLKPNSVASASAGRWLRMVQMGVPHVITKTAPQSVASSTVLVNDTQLLFNLSGTIGMLVQARLALLGGSGTGQGYKVNFTFSGSLGGNTSSVGLASSNGSAAVEYFTIGTAFTAAAISDTTGDEVNVDFILNITANGTFQVQFAQDSSSANPTTMQAGSCLLLTRLY